ncbi:MAG: hypothetical protein E7211_16870 [Clostridium lundense]|nr:hypothetical protein [Clostridium lundense]
MIYFKSADELKKMYEVYANFYKMMQADGKIYTCRNVADIYDKEFKASNIKSKPQALIIMMNPGSCEPKDKDYNIPNRTIDKLYKISINASSVLCKADNAQYQIMRIMDIKKWKHIRIVNLSDIKCSNGDEFKDRLKGLQEIDKKDMHSIFSSKRTMERDQAFLLESNAPIILAWGIDKKLIHLARKCVQSIPMENCRGIKYDEYLYYYPSPLLKTGKEAWLHDISKIV